MILSYPPFQININNSSTLYFPLVRPACSASSCHSADARAALMCGCRSSGACATATGGASCRRSGAGASMAARATPGCSPATTQAPRAHPCGMPSSGGCSSSRIARAHGLTTPFECSASLTPSRMSSACFESADYTSPRSVRRILRFKKNFYW